MDRAAERQNSGIMARIERTGERLKSSIMAMKEAIAISRVPGRIRDPQTLLEILLDNQKKNQGHTEGEMRETVHTKGFRNPAGIVPQFSRHQLVNSVQNTAEAVDLHQYSNRQIKIPADETHRGLHCDDSQEVQRVIRKLHGPQEKGNESVCENEEFSNVVTDDTITSSLRPVYPTGFVSAVPLVSRSDPNVDRLGLQDSIRGAITEGSAVLCVLHGPKGVGKTRLAYQFAKKWRGSVRWFHANNYETLKADYHNFVQDCLGKTSASAQASWDDPQLAASMRDLIASTPNALLIFDDVQDEGLVEALLDRFFPTGGMTVPKVLFTTSSSTMFTTGTWSCLDHDSRISVPVFTDCQVSTFLRQTQLKLRGSDFILSLQIKWVFQNYVNNLPRCLDIVWNLVKGRPSMDMEQILAFIKLSIETPNVTTLVCRHTKGWDMLCHAALSTESVSLESLRVTMEITEEEADHAAVSLAQLSLATIQYSAGVAHLVLHDQARAEAAVYVKQNFALSSALTPSERLLAAQSRTIEAEEVGNEAAMKQAVTASHTMDHRH